MKKLLCMILALGLLAGCTAAPAQTTAPAETIPAVSVDSIAIRLSDEGVEFPADSGVYTANDIIYYEEGHDESYGEGEPGDAHSAEEAAAHTVVHITKPGTYTVSGKLSLGQIAVDLGEEAENDPNAVVTLILDGLDITCRVAPAIIFYNVYECGDTENPTADVDTSDAGANVILAPGSNNRVMGSHVAKIYKPGTEKKLHKYDAAFYSKMSMNVGGEGILRIEADNEGLDSELHLTINGGEIFIESGNDGINTNADGLSVTTVNGGFLRIDVAGTTGEGDGIDSNGWLVINGGRVEAYACGSSMDSGIDSDLGIQINGGTVIATGNMLDRIEEGGQTYAVLQFAQSQHELTWTLKDPWDSPVMECHTPNDFSNLLFSSPALTEGTYTLFSGDTRFMGAPALGGFVGGFQPIERPDWPGRDDGDVEIPPQPTVEYEIQGGQPPARPEDMPLGQPPEGSDPSRMPGGPMPDGSVEMPPVEMPEGVRPPQDGYQGVLIPTTALTTDFAIHQGANYFYNVQAAK